MNSKIKLDNKTLKALGLKENDFVVYTTLLSLGSAPLRKIAEYSALSRATAYDALKRLKSAGLVGYIDAKTHRYFVAEDPQKLNRLATKQEVAIQTARLEIESALPKLRGLIGKYANRPAVRYFEGEGGVKEVLRDVLYTTGKARNKLYRVYSSAQVRDLIAAAWPRYNQKRKALKINVRAIAIGEGGKTHGLDERRWLSYKEAAPTYIFIYGRKTAYVSVDKQGKLFCAVIDDAAIADTQRMIFDSLWLTLN
ncbi:TrmB family transcriptional regulator [Candidatus Parcubacteria bacterium]|nr:MAG: TrmB family transcriptional regulator [Candidatus Parcubacteria bacterium]